MTAAVKMVFVRKLVRILWPGLGFAVLLIPAVLVWLDLARGAATDRHAYLAAGRRVIVLGFDGVDPDLVTEYRNSLPTLYKLA